MNTLRIRRGRLPVVLVMVGGLLASSALAAPRWGNFHKGKCTGVGFVEQSAILWDINGSWEEVCARTPADIKGHHFTQPASCKKHNFRMWGYFDVPDDKCMPHWGDFKKDGCTGQGLRQYSAILWDIKDLTWEAACDSMPAYVEGVQFEKPSRCKNTGLNMWGEFDVPDASCGPLPR